MVIQGENRKGKLKLRGLYNTRLYSIAMAIVINFGRIAKHKKLITNKNKLFQIHQVLYSRLLRITQLIIPDTTASVEHHIHENALFNSKFKGAFFSRLNS